MLELSSVRKNKINLADYNCQQDIQNRMLMADFSALDVEVLGEILFSSLKTSVKKLERSLGCDPKASLKKLAQTGLLSVQEDAVLVDKESRKYFEFQMARFDPHFRPDMEFIQGILKRVPIHVLPIWYSVPRTSNNIFESIVEKYLLTPQAFQRYLSELRLAGPFAQSIAQDVFASPHLKLSSTDLISKYNLTRAQFEETMLLLEFHFACCITYQKEDDHWVELVTPFYEWQEYLRFLRDTEAKPVATKVERVQTRDFAFIEEMAALLEAALKKPVSLQQAPSHFVDKLCLIQLAERVGGKLHPLETAADWLQSKTEDKALYLYRHPHNKLMSSPKAASERSIREAEKAVKRVLHGKWVFFDDFLKGVTVPLSEHSVIAVKRVGKHWNYTLPVYSDDEKQLIEAVIFEWLFEMGMVMIGTSQGRKCFAVTPFGRFFFEE